MSNEERARRMGWVPQEDFRGDPAKWVDADTFVDRGENMMPLLKENLSRMEQKFESLEKDSAAKIDKLTDTIEKFAQFHKTTAQRAYKRAEKELKSKMREAVASGDTIAFDAISKEMETLSDEIKEPESKPPQGGVHPDYPSWQQANAWYGADQELTAFANGVGPIVAQEHPDMNGKPFFEEVTKRVRATFPHKFTNPNKEKPVPVEGGGGGGGSDGKKKKGWSDLPNEAKEAYSSHFAGIKGFSKDDYAKDYWTQEEDK